MNFLPEIPICKLKQRNVDKRFNANHVGESTTDLCYLFVQFLIDRKIVEGSNPFHPVKKTQPSEKKLEKAAFSQQELGEEVFRKMFDLLNNEITPTNCVIALLISGFTLKDISDLIWGDIEFVREHKDFAVIHIRKEYLRAAKHDFSRPAIPDTALYLRKARAKFSKECQANFEDVPIKPKELDSRKVAAAVNNLLVMAGFNGQLTAAGRPSGDEPIPIQVLRTNYERMLNDCAGLKDDPDTRNFLLGRLFKSSTYINYESHTSEEAQYRLYTILKPLAVEAKINKKSGITKYSDKLVYEAFPNSNHEVVQITGKITFRCNQQIKIQSAHGVTGYFEVVDNY
jgi:hypothetical protein